MPFARYTRARSPRNTTLPSCIPILPPYSIIPYDWPSIVSPLTVTAPAADADAANNAVAKEATSSKCFIKRKLPRRGNPVFGLYADAQRASRLGFFRWRGGSQDLAMAPPGGTVGNPQ